MNDTQEFHEWLNTAMKEHQISQKELSAALGVSVQYVNIMLHGKRPPTKVFRLAVERVIGQRQEESLQ